VTTPTHHVCSMQDTKAASLHTQSYPCRGPQSLSSGSWLASCPASKYNPMTFSRLAKGKRYLVLFLEKAINKAFIPKHSPNASHVLKIKLFPDFRIFQHVVIAARTQWPSLPGQVLRLRIVNSRSCTTWAMHRVVLRASLYSAAGSTLAIIHGGNRDFIIGVHGCVAQVLLKIC